MATKIKSVFYDRANKNKYTIYKRIDDGLLSIERYNFISKSKIVLRRHRKHAEYSFYLDFFYKGLNNKRNKLKKEM